MDTTIESALAAEPTIQPCAGCGTPIDVSGLEPLETVGCPACGADVVIEGSVDWFALQAEAGRGGMGVVYRAFDQRLGRHVAIKLLRRVHSSDAAQVALLETEAAITASVSHPHVVKVFSTGVARGQFYIAMELVNKGSLDQLIRIQGRVAEAQVLEVAIQIASGLEAALSHGLIHRDIKPGNILFADARTAKIVDFGLATFISTEQTIGGEIWGTPYYVAPEKLDQKPEDFRSDIYSLGATLFHALAGRPPFEAKDASHVALKHLKSKAPSLQAFAPDVSSRTAYIINRTLAKNPAERYQSYGELIEHLTYARSELLTGAGKVRKPQRLVLESAQEKNAWGLVVMALLTMTAAALVLFFVFAGRSSKALAEPGGSFVEAGPAEPTKPARPVVASSTKKSATDVLPAGAAAETKLKTTGNGFGLWQNTFINPGRYSARAGWESGVLSWEVLGGNQYGDADSIPLIYQKVAGDFELRALVTAVAASQKGARIGLTARESFSPGAPHVSIAVRASSVVAFSRRAIEGTSTFLAAGGTGKLPVWIKLVRSGLEIEGFSSADGLAWKSSGKQRFHKLPAEIVVGLSSVAGTDEKCSGTLEQVELKHLL